MISTAEQLAGTYATLSKTTPVLDAVIKTLQLKMSPAALASTIQTRIIIGTTMLQFTVTYTDPVVAADIANTLAQQLIDQSPSHLTKDQEDQLTLLQSEILKAEDQIQTYRSEINTIEANIKSLSGSDQAILATRRNDLQSQVVSVQQSLSQMATTAVTLQQRGQINAIQIVDPAVIPQNPVGPTTVTSSVIAAGGAAIIAAGLAFLIEYLNNSIRSPSEVLPLLNVPAIATIAPFGPKTMNFGRQRTYKDKLIAWTDPRSPISEAYRALRVNLMYRDNSDNINSSANGNDPHTDCHVYIVTSPGPAEGKSVTASNLAITFANTGMRVLMIDTDLRRPTLHQLFNLPNTSGLANIWGTGDPSKHGGAARGHTSVHIGGPLRDEFVGRKVQLLFSHLIQKTEIPNLDIIPSGPPPSNPAELLGTVEMAELVQQLTNSGLYDVLFFDTPPVLVLSDSSVVASVTKGAVILVVESGRTNRSSALRAVQQLTSLSIPVLGVVMNRLHPRDVDAGYGEYYYGYYRYGEARQKATATKEA
jgi:non-specific protein-tyrosine kinase